MAELRLARVGGVARLTLDRSSTFTDVIALSASTAYPYLSSVNPAAVRSQSPLM